MRQFAKLGALWLAIALPTSSASQRQPFVSVGAPASVRSAVQAAQEPIEVRATRWYKRWAISTDTTSLADSLGRYEGHFLQEGSGDTLAIDAYDLGHPDLMDDEECLYAWMQIPSVAETDLPLRIDEPQTSAKACACAWGVCREIESSGHVRLISTSDDGVTAEVTIEAEGRRVVHTGTFSSAEPPEEFRKTIE